MKIGVIGGTFNPIHYGHLFIASQAKECFKLDEVVFVPSSQPPHKGELNLERSEDRYRMIELAIKSNSDFSVSSVELDRGGKSYSVETVTEFQKKYGKDTEIYFVIGMDSFTELSTWKDIDGILKKCQFIVAPRPGYGGQVPQSTQKRRDCGVYPERDCFTEFTLSKTNAFAMTARDLARNDTEFSELSRKVCSSYGKRCHFMEAPCFEISSTDIRNRIKEGRSIKYLLPEPVEKYIIEHELYK